MIDRYTLPEMAEIWNDYAKYKSWLDVELAACEANHQLGNIPEDDMIQIRNTASFDIDRILEIEKEVKHDVIAFLTSVNENVGDSGRYIHVGMTSSDVLDTALSLQLKASVSLLIEEINNLDEALYDLMNEHKDTVMIGRSHAIHGEPITFGFKLAGWLAETNRNAERLDRLERNISVGQVSGAMGTYANTNPEVERIACGILGLTPDIVSTQVISRDRHADYIQTLALVASSLDRFATEIRNLQRSDVLEVEEGFSKGQKGSSAMPHKRNPIRSERISGLSRVLRSYVVAALENVVLWHERDISHSSIERMMFPDCSATLHFMLREMTEVIQGLNVYPENMIQNMNKNGCVVFSQKVMLALVKKGMIREDAYKLVQTSAHSAWNVEDGSFLENLKRDSKVGEYLNDDELAECFSTEADKSNLDTVWKRMK